MLGPKLLYCDPTCAFFVEKTGVCRLAYMIDRLCYAVPQVGNAAQTFERGLIARVKSAEKVQRQGGASRAPGSEGDTL